MPTPGKTGGPVDKHSDDVTHPQDAFDSPMEIPDSKTLSRDDKNNALDTWETDERALQRASVEGMTGGAAPRISDVEQARRKLNADDQRRQKRPSHNVPRSKTPGASNET